MAPGEDSSPVGAVAAEISNAIVHLLSERYGRGPTKAKTYLFDNYVFCVLQNVLTTAEQTLVASGQADLVRKTRLAFQEDRSHFARLRDRGKRGLVDFFLR